MAVDKWWQHPKFPRASAYDPDWLLELDMGPHPLWLLEDLARDLDLRPGQRVLDLGCGGGATSVFLAREYGAEVWATDLWLPRERITELMARPELADVNDRIHVVNADARALPYEEEQFDVIVSIDAWEYFGTDDWFLPGLLRHLRPGGQVAMATPCLDREFATYEECPAHVRELVGWEATAWHTPAWWRTHWQRCGLVDVTSARAQETGWSDWLRWSRAVAARNPETGDRKVRVLLRVTPAPEFSLAQLEELPAGQVIAGSPTTMVHPRGSKVPAAASEGLWPAGVSRAMVGVEHNRATSGGAMKAQVGDRLVVVGTRVGDSDRIGVVTEILHEDGSPPYRVRWQDSDNEVLIYPGPDARVVPKKPADA